MPPSSSSASYDPNTYWVAPKRNFRSSARLHLQHGLFQKTLNNPQILHPSIIADVSSSSTTMSGLRVADIGCGNAVWLCDLHDSLTSKGSTTHRLDGYDINTLMFPPRHTLPAQIQLSQLDVFFLPVELEGVYNVVHLRAFCSIVTRNDPSAIISVVMRMLKPGGWVQWEETRADKQTCAAPSPPSDDSSSDAVTAQSTETLIKIISAGGEAIGNTFGFLGNLGEHLEKGGFVDVQSKQHAKRQADMKGWTENYLMVWEEIPDLLPRRSQAPNSPVTKESFADLFVKCVAETEAGVVLHQEGVVCVVGRKPL